MSHQFTCQQCGARFDPLSGSSCVTCGRLLCLRCFYGRFALFSNIRALFGRRTCNRCEDMQKMQPL